MRTTLTLDADVVRLLKEEEARRRTSFKDVVNDAIRRGLAPGLRNQDAPPYEVSPHRTSLRPGIDPAAFNKLADELEDEAVLAKTIPER